MYNTKKTYLIIFILINSLIGFTENKPEIKSIRTDPYARFISFDPYLGKNCGDITDIFQDDHGYIWLTGTKCLSRFDGNRVKHYINDWTPSSLPSSKILCIEQDVFGRLWIGTANGLCRYDYKNDNFITVIGPDTTSPPADTFYIRALLADGDSLLWMETLPGYLCKLNLKTLELIKYYKHIRIKQPYYYYHTIYRDHDKKLWFGGRSFGPHYLDEINNAIKSPKISKRQGDRRIYQSYDAAYILNDQYGNLWFGALDGIFVYNDFSDVFELFKASSSWSMTESSDGKLWFGTGEGLAKYSPENGEMILYEHNEENPESLPGNYIYKIYEDNYNNIWVSTSNGVSVYKPDPAGIGYLFHIPGMDETPASSSICDLMKDDSGKVWIATEGKGLDEYDPIRHTIRHFNTSNTDGLPSNNFRCLEMGNGGSIFCGLWAGMGFGKLTPSKNQFKLYSYSTLNTHSDWYNDLEFDENGKLYVGFWGGPGLTLFDTINENFGRFLKNKFHNPYISRLITCLYFDSRNKLWMGTTQSGLHMYDPVSDTSICFSKEINPEQGIETLKIYDIAEDSSGNIWIGAKGLYYQTQENKKFNIVEFPEKYIDPEIFGLLPYRETDIWLLSNYGLLRYNRLFDKILDYSHIVNIDFKENHASSIQLNKGILIFGGKNGLALIDPQRVEITQKFPEAFLSSLMVFDKIKFPNLQNIKDIQLRYKENFFTISVGSNSWGDNKRFRYFYKLDQFNQDWIEMQNNERLARFTNVPPGKYTFHVKVIDNQGNELQNAVSASLTITPPIYRTWWFITLIILTALSIILFIWWNRLRSLRLSLSNIELNQKLLRLQMNPHFIFNSLFAIQNYIYSNQTHLAGNYLSDFAHLIRLILDNSRHEYILFEKEYECIDLYLKLQKLRFEDQFTYSIHYDKELKDNHFYIPPMLAQPFLENAIEHGIKNLNREGHIDVEYKVDKNNIIFSVRDNGIGLTAARKIKEQEKQKHESLAISICKKRLEILNRKNNSRILFSINEIRNNTGNIEGTMVKFKIPYKISVTNSETMTN